MSRDLKMSFDYIDDIKQNLDMGKIPRKARRAQSEQYMERLEGLRAETGELLSHSGDQFMDKVFRGGATGARSASRAMQ